MSEGLAAEKAHGASPWAWVAGAAWLWLSLRLAFVALSGNDELNQLAQAWRVAQGDRLYQGVWEFAAPLPLLAAALAFKLAGGPSLLLARMLASLVVALALSGLWRLGRALGLAPWAGALAAWGFAWGAFPGYPAYYHHWCALAALLWALAWGARASQGQAGATAWAASGACAAVAAWCTQSSGPVALGALGLMGLAWAWRGGAWAPAWRAAGAGLAGALGVTALVSAFFAWQGGLGSLWHQVWVWPATHYRLPGGTNDVWPLSDLGAMFFPMWAQAMSPWLWLGRVVGLSTTALLPLVGAFAGAAVVAWRLALLPWHPLSAQAPARLGFALALALVGAMAWRGKADWTHLAEAAPLASLAWAWWASQSAALLARQQALGLRLALLGPTLALGAWLSLCGLDEARALHRAWRAGQVGWSIDAIQRGTPFQQALRQHLRPGGRLWAFPSSGSAYLFGGGRHATRFGLLMPLWDRYNGPEDYEALRADWRAQPPEVVVLVGRTGAKAVLEWGGAPDLGAYRRVGVYPGPPGEEAIPHELWVLGEAGASGGP